MAYSTYTTTAIVCGSRASNTSDKAYLLFTRDDGMLWATARSVREERSRQRCALQDFSMIRVSLVKGKSGWRIGSVEAMENVFFLAKNRAARGGVTSVVKLLRRFISGEQAMSSVYDDVVLTLQWLHAETDVRSITRGLEVLELRLLHQLGYIALPAALAPVIEEVSTPGALHCYEEEHTALTKRLLEKAAQVSHL